MATSMIPKTRIIVGATTIDVPDFTINANSGRALSAIVSDYAISVPTGMSILANVDVIGNGVSGLIVNFDGAGAFTSTSPAVFIFNALGSSRTISGLKIRFLTLFV